VATGVGLAIQRLRTEKERLLAVANIAGHRNEDQWFGPADTRLIFEILRIPHDSRNTLRDLRRLAADGLVLKRSRDDAWALTPEGDDAIRHLLADLDLRAIAPALARVASADYMHEVQALVPPDFAPAGLRRGISALLAGFDFDRNVFLMTRFPSDPSDASYLDPVSDVILVAKRVLGEHGLHLHLASDSQLVDDVYSNVAGYMWACRYGLALLEDRLDVGLNDNVLIEVGSMLMTGRRCGLLRDRDVPDLPADVAAQIYKPVDFDDLTEVADQVHRWARDDLRLGPCASCPNQLLH
jgi:hypothetical protein